MTGTGTNQSFEVPLSYRSAIRKARGPLLGLRTSSDTTSLAFGKRPLRLPINASQIERMPIGDHLPDVGRRIEVNFARLRKTGSTPIIYIQYTHNR